MVNTNGVIIPFPTTNSIVFAELNTKILNFSNFKIKKFTAGSFSYNGLFLLTTEITERLNCPPNNPIVLESGILSAKLNNTGLLKYCILCG
jgi:hypothetical protein